MQAGVITSTVGNDKDVCTGASGGGGLGPFVEGSVEKCITPSGNTYTKISGGAGVGAGVEGAASGSLTGGFSCNNKGDKK